MRENHRGSTMPPAQNPHRIAVLGFAIECNRFAPVATREDFLSRGYWEGDALSAEARREAPSVHAEIPGFYKAMDASGPWLPVPILFTQAEPGGPADHAFFESVAAKIEAGLRAAGR